MQIELDLDVIKFLPLQLNCNRCNASTTHHYVDDKSDIKDSQLLVYYGAKKTSRRWYEYFRFSNSPRYFINSSRNNFIFILYI